MVGAAGRSVAAATAENLGTPIFTSHAALLQRKDVCANTQSASANPWQGAVATVATWRQHATRPPRQLPRLHVTRDRQTVALTPLEPEPDRKSYSSPELVRTPMWAAGGAGILK